MATWCTACIEHLPNLRQIRGAFDESQLDLIALPVDPDDDPQELAEYRQKVDPPYRLVDRLSPAQRDQIQAVLNEVTPADAIPATIVTDAAGNVRFAVAGAPTISQLRQLLQSLPTP